MKRPHLGPLIDTYIIRVPNWVIKKKNPDSFLLENNGGLAAMLIET